MYFDQIIYYLKKFTSWLFLPWRGGGTPEKSGGVCGPLPKTPTLFKTKICDFLCPIITWPKTWYPVFDLTLTSMPCFQTCLIISCLVQTDVKGIVKGYCCWCYLLTAPLWWCYSYSYFFAEMVVNRTTLYYQNRKTLGYKKLNWKKESLVNSPRVT